MKKLSIWLLIIVFIASMLIMGVGCKEEAAVVDEEVVEEATEEVTEEPIEEGSGNVIFYHYWSSGSWMESVDAFLEGFGEKYPNINVRRNDIESEAFKTSIGVTLAGGNPPDVFSYWAGARTKFFVDRDLLMDISEVWNSANLDQSFSPEIKGAAAVYNGKVYAVPISMFPMYVYYNKHIFDEYDLVPPTTWEEFLNICDTLKSNGITPIALGTKFRWPAYVWFDALLVRTAGIDFREGLMQGTESYTDPKVLEVFELWKELLEKGYFDENHASYNWAEAVGTMVRGETAMNYQGAFATGALITDLGQEPLVDFDFFKLPAIDPSLEEAIPVSYDVIVASKEAPNPDSLKYFMEYAASVEGQQVFKEYIGCLSPNKNLPEEMYSELEKKEIEQMTGVRSFFPYDLATDPAVADTGLTAFSKFLANPGDYESIMAEVEAAAIEVFNK